ncbi:MAG: hypothetical protein Q8781_02095, partial [Candidatus Phytoplasma stylosanthis]|uniref:hypothetical protein n=1 Tax=Candidatus Phytoplasma stylosanthis TaxID=2798314 RepID=UPI00293B5842
MEINKIYKTINFKYFFYYFIYFFYLYILFFINNINAITSQSTLSLKDVLTQTDLGELTNNSQQTIIDRIKTLNKSLKDKNLQISAVDEKSALVSSKDYGSLILKVHFHLKSHTSPSQSTLSLKDVLTQTDLGELTNNSQQTIIDRIKTLNKSLKDKN